MRPKLLLFGLLSVALLSQLPTSEANEGNPKSLVLGATTQLHLLGNSLTASGDPRDVFGIIPPCTPAIALDYKAIPCIRSVQYRKSPSSTWMDAILKERTLEPFIEPNQETPALELIDTKWTDGWWYLSGGSASLWEINSVNNVAAGSKTSLLVEATVSSRVTPRTFSLSLVPVQVDSDKSYELSEFRESTLRRQTFLDGYEFQVIIKQSQRMQPLQFVTSRTKGASVTVNALEFVFRGQPSTHSLLKTDPLECSDPIMVQTYGTRCNSLPLSERKIYPWDREIIPLLESTAMERFKVASEVAEWSFQGGQDTSLISDFIIGCSFSNLFSFTSTNAPAYHINPPRWDKDSSSLLFKIANTHLDARSQVQQGYFSIQLRLSSAACMWGIDRKSVTASVEVIAEDGSSQLVSSSSIKIDEAADTVSINLAGFTFSSPTIKIKLLGKAVGSGSTGIAKTVKRTFTCKKGKQRIQVHVREARCPSGFKRV